MAEKFINGLDFQINFKNTELFVQYFKKKIKKIKKIFHAFVKIIFTYINNDKIKKKLSM